MKQEEKKQKNKHYISAKESREIVKNNNRTIRELQKKRKTYKRDDYVTEMKDPNNIVEFEDLHTYFFTDNGVVKAVNGVSFSIPQGSTVGVVGESGCGKSVTSLSLMQLVQGPMGQIVSGSIRFRSTVREPHAEPVMEQKLDEFGAPVVDENGEPVMVQALDKKGNPVFKKQSKEPLMIQEVRLEPVFDENGEPVMVQALDKKGNPVFKTRKVEKVNDGEESVLDEGMTISEDAEQSEQAESESASVLSAEESLGESKESAIEDLKKFSFNDIIVPLKEKPYVDDDEDDEVAEEKKFSIGGVVTAVREGISTALDTVVEKAMSVLPEREKEPVMVQKVVEVPLFDEDGNPKMVQALNKYGKPRYKNKYTEHEEVVDIAKMPISEMSKIRGREIAMIFQEPMTSLNPVFTIGYQLDEVTLLHVGGADKEDAKKRSIEMLKLVGIAMPEHVYNSYPHQLSGGMRQRVMIAMALCCNPKLIIADEPTTALDVTIQAQILDLLREVKDKISGSIMLITHDLGVIAEMVDYVVVMYAGRVVEKGTVREIFKNPLHPYTIGLQKSKPVVGKNVDRLYSIPGNVPNPIDMPSTCYFRDRCDMRCDACRGDYPEMVQVSPTHFVACHRYKDLQKEDNE